MRIRVFVDISNLKKNILQYKAITNYQYIVVKSAKDSFNDMKNCKIFIKVCCCFSDDDENHYFEQMQQKPQEI